MNKADADVLYEVAELMKKCPNISPNPYEIEGTMKACHDFQTINRLVATIVDKYTEYSLHKSKLNDPDFDGEYYIQRAKEIYQEKLLELKNFIRKRTAENWK